VVGIDVQVTFDLHREVEEAVLAEGGEHVVVEADAGADVGASGAVEIDLDQHLRLVRAPLDAAGSRHCEF
jgi:hypothetical protein